MLGQNRKEQMDVGDGDDGGEKSRQRAEWLVKAEILTAALPYMRRYSGRSLVIKYGGHAMGDARLARLFAQDIVLLKQVGVNPIVVHGGGPQIAGMLKRLSMPTQFVDGLRVTDKETVEIVEMVLSGSINKGLVATIQDAGGRAVGLSGKDGGMIRARKLTRRVREGESNLEKILDLGFVGEPEKIDLTLLSALTDSEVIPVIAPLGQGADGRTYNINADTVAGAIAAATGAHHLLLLTDVPGIMDGDGRLIASLNPAEAEELLAGGAVTGGMIPKLETCVRALRGGAAAAAILDGREAHAILLELFTEHGSGTLIRPDGA